MKQLHERIDELIAHANRADEITRVQTEYQNRGTEIVQSLQDAINIDLYLTVERFAVTNQMLMLFEDDEATEAVLVFENELFTKA
jgi:hypothetical protein